MLQPSATEKMENLAKRCEKNSSQDGCITDTKINEWKLNIENY